MKKALDRNSHFAVSRSVESPVNVESARKASAAAIPACLFRNAKKAGIRTK